MTANLQAITLLLTGWLNDLPSLWRARIYRVVKVVSGVLTLAILLLPLLGDLGVVIPTPERWVALLTALLTFLSTLAGRHVADSPPEDHPQDDEALF